MIVRDIMTENPRTVEVTDNIADALDVLHDLDVRHVPVVEEGRLVGLLSDRDLRSYSLPAIVEMRNPDKAAARLEHAVSEIMRGDVISIGAEDDVIDLVRLMIDHKYGAVPVVDAVEGTLVGIVSYLDVLTAVEDLL
jgi:acetoin utilization protein AcuB